MSNYKHVRALKGFPITPGRPPARVMKGWTGRLPARAADAAVRAGLAEYMPEADEAVAAKVAARNAPPPPPAKPAMQPKPMVKAKPKAKAKPKVEEK